MKDLQKVSKHFRKTQKTELARRVRTSAQKRGTIWDF